MTKSFILSIFLIVGCIAGLRASAEERALVESVGEISYCYDGKLHLFAADRQHGGPLRPDCYVLTDTSHTFGAEVNISFGVEFAPGNILNYMLRQVYRDPSVTFEDLPSLEASNYLVKAGHCGKYEIFVVQEVSRVPGRQALNMFQQYSANQCKFENETMAVAISDLDITGVYQRFHNMTVTEFLQSKAFFTPKW